jgi:hypothetical protein
MDDARASNGPWTVRNMAEADQQMAVEAAKRAGQNVAEWLGAAIRSYVGQERSNGTSYDVQPPPPRRALATIQPTPSLAMSQGAIQFFAPNITALVDAACKLASTRKLPKVLRDTANQTLREHLAAYAKGEESK